MMSKFSIILFSPMLMISTFIAISSTSWFNLWMSIEINSMAFIPMTMLNNWNFSFNSIIIYFIIQSLSSSIMLFSSYMMNLNSNNYIFMLMIMFMNMSMFMKLGMFPFHWWLPIIMTNLSWINCLIISTWQKIIPFIILQYFMNMKLMILSSIMTAFIATIYGINYLNTKKIIAYSSMNHMSWMSMCLMLNLNLWWFYMYIYSSMSYILISLFKNLNLNFIQQSYNNMNNKMINSYMFMILISMMSIPPFTGFSTKWFIILKMNMMFLLMFMLIIILTLVSMMFYLRMMFSNLLLISYHTKIFPPMFNQKIKKNFNLKFMIYFLMIINILFTTLFIMTN
uniref:NADH-ubiquinone oxidoreductase chain 2 n=1 Tax=Foenatopus ruficollis TaxID=1738635 RepID=A0A342I4D9_9HYME|nr:NADH dehydrogenase subunit 2 [Foenatopus ruficollis]